MRWREGIEQPEQKKAPTAPASTDAESGERAKRVSLPSARSSYRASMAQMLLHHDRTGLTKLELYLISQRLETRLGHVSGVEKTYQEGQDRPALRSSVWALLPREFSLVLSDSLIPRLHTIE